MDMVDIARARSAARVKIRTGDCPVVAVMALAGKSYRAAEQICRKWGYKGDGLTVVETLCALEDALGRSLPGTMTIIKDAQGKCAYEVAGKVGYGVIFSEGHVMPVVDGKLINAPLNVTAKVAIKLPKNRR